MDETPKKTWKRGGPHPGPYYPSWSFPFRLQRLSRALGWPYTKLSKVMGLDLGSISFHLRTRYRYGNKYKGPASRLYNLRSLMAIEKTYAKVLRKYSKVPWRWNRLKAVQRKRIRPLQPLPVFDIYDPKSVELLEAYCRAEAKAIKPPLTEGDKERRSLAFGARGRAISQTIARKRANGWRYSKKPKKI